MGSEMDRVLREQAGVVGGGVGGGSGDQRGGWQPGGGGAGGAGGRPGLTDAQEERAMELMRATQCTAREAIDLVLAHQADQDRAGRAGGGAVSVDEWIRGQVGEAITFDELARGATGGHSDG